MTSSYNIPELDEYPMSVWGSLEDECHFLSDVLTWLKIHWQRGLGELMISAKGFWWTGRPLYVLLAFRLCSWFRALEFTVFHCVSPAIYCVTYYVFVAYCQADCNSSGITRETVCLCIETWHFTIVRSPKEKILDICNSMPMIIDININININNISCYGLKCVIRGLFCLFEALQPSWNFSFELH